jgi:hypothetical protein
VHLQVAAPVPCADIRRRRRRELIEQLCGRFGHDRNRSERAGQRVMAGLAEFIQRRLRLKINQAKSAVARPEDRHFLDFRLRLASIR